MSEISWLLLERYALGEVSPEEKARVEAALASDLVLRRRWNEIRPKADARRRAIAIAASLVLPAIGLLTWSALQTPVDTRAKGDTLALSVMENAGRYKLHVTCVPPREITLRVWVEQGGEVSEPLGANVAVMCSNDADVPGALGFDSHAPAKVCVASGADQSCVEIQP